MASKKIVRYKCPYCEKRMVREDLVIHVEEDHYDMIPEGFTPFRLVFNTVNKKSLEYHGKCTECGGPTDWDEKKGRYNRQCNKKSCHDSFVKNFEANMIRTKGITRISSTAEGQQKMLANRKISGTYKFKNGVEKTYTGSYELKALEFMDKVMDISPDDIMCPGPVLEYVYDGKLHLYITDFYYQPYNLIIEVKDGGKRPNKRDMPSYRGKQIAKEQYLIRHTDYNYLRLTDNDLSQLLAVMADLKMQMVEHSGERVIHVNEAMNALTSGYIPGFKDTGSVYVVNYMSNNVFTGELEQGYGITDNIKLDTIIHRNKEGVLEKVSVDFLEDKSYDVFMVDKSVEEVSTMIAPYIGEFVEEGFIYETLFGKKMYTYDQINCEESATPVIDYYKYMEVYEQVCLNYFRGNILSGNVMKISESESLSIDTGKYRLSSPRFPELFIESDKKFDPDCIERKILECITLEVENGSV